MSKNKPFQPPVGFIVAVHQNIFAARMLGDELGIPALQIAKALERAGFYLVADIMDLSADTAKVILLQEKGQHLEVVKNEQPNNDSATGGEQTEGVES
jgi:hypothetical protein